MQLAKMEFKKIMLKQKGLVFLFFFTLLKVLSLFFFDKPMNADMQMEYHYYNHYVKELGGKLTDEKKELFFKEQKRLIEADSALQILNSKYYEGNIDKEEYEVDVKELKQVLKYEQGFHVIYDQFIFSMENIDNRYIMFTNGWEGLLAREYIDWIFILLLLLLITPIFCEEISSGMDSIILTEVDGGRQSAACKVLLSIIVTATASIFNSLIESVFFLCKYGLDNGSYPLQSLSFFSNSNKEVSILSAFLGIHIIRLFGSIFFTITVLFFSVVMRRYGQVLLLSTTILLIPYSIFSMQSTKYVMPTPLGFLLSTGYYRGNQYKLDLLTRENRIVFNEILSNHLLILIFISTSIMIYMTYVSLDKNTNILYKSSIRQKGKSNV